MKHWTVIFLLFILVIFVVQNHAVIQIQFMIWSFRASRAVVLFLTLVAGMLIGALLAHRK